MPVPHCEYRTLQSYPWVCFLWTIPCCAWVYPWKLLLSTVKHPCRKFFCLQVEIAFGLGVVARVLLSCRSWCRHLLAFCMPPQALWASVLLCLGLLSWCFLSLLALKFFPLPSQLGSLNPEEAFDGHSPLRAECCKVSHSLHLVWRCLHVCPPTAGRSFSNDGWTRHWSRSVTECH